MDERQQVLPPALSVVGLNKTFPGTRALIDVDFEIAPGEVHALVGQNGSGKSTFIKILAGFYQPDESGSHNVAQDDVDAVDGRNLAAEIRGEPFRLGDPHAADAAGLRFVHQDLGLVDDVSVSDNLAVGFGYVTGFGGRIKWREQHRRAHEAVRALDCDLDVRRHVSDLSAVEKTVVAIARAMYGFDGSVPLLTLDEPTASMPAPEVERMFQLIRRVRSIGVSVLYVSHHLDEVFEIADRVSVFRDGRRVATERIIDIDHRQLVELMTGGWIDEPEAASEHIAGDNVLVLDGLKGRTLIDFDVTVAAGETVGVAGLAGSGRDELSAMVFGGAPRTGSVSINGNGVEAMRPDLSVSAGMALVPANRRVDGLVVSMSVRENITLGDVSAFRVGGRLRARQERKEAMRWIDDLSIKTPSCETLAESLSGGNQQKVVVARWLRMKPKVLILEEPTQGVDVAAKAEIHGLVAEIARSGTAVLVCSSDEAELERLCDRVVVLRRGVVAAQLRGDQVTASRIAQESLGTHVTA